MASTHGRTLRSPAELIREAAGALLGQQSGIETRYYDGAVSAYEWVLGRAEVGPISGELLSATIYNILSEEELADRVLTGRASESAIDPRYANGVQHALMWSRQATDDSPGDLFATA